MRQDVAARAVFDVSVEGQLPRNNDMGRWLDDPRHVESDFIALLCAVDDFLQVVLDLLEDCVVDEPRSIVCRSVALSFIACQSTIETYSIAEMRPERRR